MNILALLNQNVKFGSARTIASTVTVALLLWGTMFLNVGVFVEAQMISKWYALIAGALCCLLIMTLGKDRRVALDSLSLLLLLFLSYVLIRGSLSGIITIKVLLFFSFFLLYLFFRSNNISRHSVELLIVLVCVSQAIYGILQYCGVFHLAGIFKVLGSFDNPAGFAASLAAGFPFCFSLRGSKILKSAGLLSALIIAAAVVLSDSRAGMLAVAVCFAIRFISTNKHILKHKRRYAIIGITVAVIAGTFLFLYKEGSSLGRMLIWNNSVNMILDRPVAGHGSGSFLSEYMVYQADYFERNPQSLLSQFADNVSHPFNEYLLLSVEYGLIGLLILAVVVAFIIGSTKRISPAISSLLAVALFACFSYPFRYAFIIVIAAYSLANIETGRQIRFDLRRHPTPLHYRR